MIEKGNINKGEKVMNNIELNSVGTAVDENCITHPIFADGTIDMDEGMAVDWIDTDDEWSSSLSNEDAKLLDDWLLENNYSVLNCNSFGGTI